MGAKWTGGVVDRRGDDDPPTVEEWRPVSVPGRPTTFADDDGPIAYRTTFADPRDDADRRATLELRGASPRAEIWLNGERLGTREPYFVPFRAAFEPRPENELVVVCDRPDSTPAIDATDELPALATGIRLDVDVESRPRTFLRRLEAAPRLADGDGVVDVELEVDAGDPVDDAITLTVRPEGRGGGATMQRVAVEAAAGERVTVSKRLEIQDPARWWPRGYGPQDRYAIRAKLGDDSIAETVGFREIERDDDGLAVNGRRIRARGFTRLPGGDPVADVERAVGANANLVRARAHVASAEFYAACDEAGLLVWQDLPGSGPHADAATDRDREGDRPSTAPGAEPAAALEATYGAHPSLAIYGGPDDPTAVVDGLYGSGFLTKLRFRYRLWRSDGAPESAAAVADAAPGARPVVSSVGTPGTAADAAALSPGWRYLAAGDADWLLDLDPALERIVGRVGVGSLADADVDPASIPGLDADVLERRVGADGDVERSQRYQARALKTVVETLRRRESAVVAVETLRDVAPGGGMGVLTADGDAKPAYRALADSFEPLQAVLDGPAEAGSVGITLCNDTHRDLEATVAWTAGDADGETEVTVGSLETAPAGTASVPRDASRIELTVRTDDRTVTNEYRL